MNHHLEHPESRHSTVRQEIYIFSKSLDTIIGNLTSAEFSQNLKHDLHRILAWFIIDHFVHNIDFIALSTKSFRSQHPDNETIISDETDYVWDSDRSHPSFINIPTDISSAAITIFSVQRDHIRINSLSFDATLLNYKAMLNDETGNIRLNSTFINTQKTLNGTRNLTQQDFQTPSQCINEEIVETMPTTTQQNISLIHPTLTTPHNKKKTKFPQTSIQSTVKPSVAPKY